MPQMISLGGTSIKVLSIALAVILGIFSWMLSPLLSFLVLMLMAGLLPVERRARAGLLIFGCICIGIGAAIASVDMPLSQIAAIKLLGSPYLGALNGI